MIKEKQKCMNCDMYQPYYTKGFCRFLKTDCGHCKKYDKETEKIDTCNEWRAIKKLPTRRSNHLTLKTLMEALYAILEIRQIFYEDYESEHNNPITPLPKSDTSL